MTSAPSAPDGRFMHDLARRLWPLHRSLTGDGVRETLRILQEHLPALTIHEVPSGTQVFDWQVPDEWTIRRATLTGPDGTVIADIRDNNLHVVSYSIPVDAELTLDELQPHLHSLPEQPDAVPYVTAYYHRTWGFCLTQDMRDSLVPGTYRARIESEISPGHLTYGEVILPGESEDEIFLSTYVCHPSLANNELSGPVVATALALHLQGRPHHYTYRIVFVPETIGAITYAALNLATLKHNVVAAINLTCIGDDRRYTYLASRLGNLRIDRIARRALATRPNAVAYSYLARGSDERHYGAPGVDLPIISLMRSRYADYPEYHTSHDDLEQVVTTTGLQGGFDFVRECLDVLEDEPVLVATQLAEPQLGRRGLYHQIMGKTVADEVMLRTNILAYADGAHSVTDMAELFGEDEALIVALTEELLEHGLLIKAHQSNHLHAGAVD